MAPGPRARFGPFEVDTATGELWRDGAVVHVQDLPFRLLAALIEQPGQLRSRADLTERIWGPGVHVDADAGLNTAIAKLRDALGDTADAPQYIETVPRRGYRFKADVMRPAPAEADRPAAPASTGPWLRRFGIAAALFVIVATLTAIAASHAPGPNATRVAVVLFDNETDDPDLDRLAQLLTDATVVRLTANDRLAVIGNAAVLRTERPFRDLELVQRTLGADLVVIGQVQQVDDRLQTLTHLIRASDQAHVWAAPTPRADLDEAAFLDAVSGAVATAVRDEVEHPGPAGR